MVNDQVTIYTYIADDPRVVKVEEKAGCQGQKCDDDDLLVGVAIGFTLRVGRIETV